MATVIFLPGRYELIAGGVSRVAELTAGQAAQIRSVAIVVGAAAPAVFRCVNVPGACVVVNPPAVNSTFAEMLSVTGG